MALFPGVTCQLWVGKIIMLKQSHLGKGYAFFVLVWTFVLDIGLTEHTMLLCKLPLWTSFAPLCYSTGHSIWTHNSLNSQGHVKMGLHVSCQVYGIIRSIMYLEYHQDPFIISYFLYLVMFSATSNRLPECNGLENWLTVPSGWQSFADLVYVPSETICAEPIFHILYTWFPTGFTSPGIKGCKWEGDFSLLFLVTH